jgi:hypothetical protein
MRQINRPLKGQSLSGVGLNEWVVQNGGKPKAE